MAWQFNSHEAVFVQIATRLRGEIVRGVYAPGVQFPSVRQLALEAAVNPNTMQKALVGLEEEGLLVTRGTLGRFVTADEVVLEEAKERSRRDAVRSWITQARAMGLNREQLIRYIEQEELWHE